MTTDAVPTMKEQYMAMDGATQFIWEYNEKAMTEIKDTLKEILHAYRGVSLTVNGCIADYDEQSKAVKELREQDDAHSRVLRAANAAIGELQQRVDKAAALYAELKNSKPKGTE